MRRPLRERLPPRWVVVVSLAVAASILGDSLLYAVLPVVWQDLGIAVGAVGVLLSVNRFVRLASNPVAGWVVARTGIRVPFLAALFVAALTTAAYASGLGFVVLLLARALWGACWSFLRLGGFMAALDAAHDGRRGYYLGFFNGVTRLGSFVAVLTGGLLTDLLGFETTALLFAALSLLGALGVVRERPPAPRRLPEPTRPAHAEHPPAAPRRPPRPDRVRFAVVSTAVFLHGLAISGLVTATLGLWLLRAYGKTTSVLGLAVGVATITGVLLSARFLGDFLWGPIVGHLADRWGPVRVTLTAGAIEAGALAMLALPVALVWTAATTVVLFLASTALQVSLDTTAGGLAPPQRRARTLGWYTTWLDLGAAAGPLLGYAIGGGEHLAWLYLAAGAALALVGIVYVAVFTGLVRPALPEAESSRPS